MSTDMITYLNYMSTWDSESDENIDKVISEQQLFTGLGDFASDAAVDSEFDVLTGLATTVRDETIAADAMQIAADAAAVASIWSFGLGMCAFVALEASEAVLKKVISGKSKELNAKLATIDTDISSKINPNVHLYIVQYKANNALIASKAPKGIDTRRCRSILMQFMAEVHRDNGKLDAAGFKKYAESARILYNSKEINDVYDALDKLNLSDKSEADVQKYLNSIKGLTMDRTAMTIIQNLSIAIMAYKLNIANKTIAKCAKAAGLEVAEVESSAFGMMDAVGKFVAVVAVVMSVVDTVLEIIDIVDVVEQTKKMCDELNGSIKTSYKAYFNGIKTSSAAYNAAIATKTG
ncbi:hypothetical protein MFIFM68171_11204 [Madurella fahalii]|uniref:Uncharacterized protein n=1 Tax=Madurella fahalii TaxID=1157608 RepID=A0ABQ0GTI5_9PEZI